MAPSRGKRKSRAAREAPPSSRRSTRSAGNDVPSVYQDLLAEAEATEPSDGEAQRPLKKRRVATSVAVVVSEPPSSDHGESSGPVNSQTVEDSSQSEDEEESDIDFEDVDLSGPNIRAPADQEDGIADISVTIDPASTPKRRVQAKRKSATAREKAFRLLIHKAHILCLLGHCMWINTWCNDEEAKRRLRRRLSKKTIHYLTPNEDDSQFQKNRSVMDGLQQASDAFRGSFVVTESGMRKAIWPTDEEGDANQKPGVPMDRSDFIAAAKDLEGSQDTANQLFCAMLRSVGVEARLICSLQCLPFGTMTAKIATPEKSVKSTVFASADDARSVGSDSNAEDVSVQTSAALGPVPRVRRRLGQPAFTPETTRTPTPKKKKKAIRKLAHPIFWTEAFNEAQQKWIPIDPIVTQTIGKAFKLEPPSSYNNNQMSYVIAFEPDGVAKDVTRRYAKAYNAKTRRHRVESTENGVVWFKKALRIFRRKGGALDRDQVEDAELGQREAREGLPTNVQDFKNHPHYALERHLKRQEVIHPKREVGKVNAGTAAKPRMEVVYRRADVCVCRSAERWFRLGREVKKGEVGVKRVAARRPRQARGDVDEEVVGEDATTMVLYAFFQTELYVPAPVVDGKIPKNAYGNLDIYVPSMVPAGGAHIRHPLAQQAARTLKIDYADAVTGFQFKGRHGTAIIEGAVVPERHAEAVNAIIDGLEDEQVEEESKARSAMALRMWRRFLTGLRIAERVSGYADSETVSSLKIDVDEAEDEQETIAEAGGFFPDEGVTLPTAGRFSLGQLSTSAKKQKTATKRRREQESEEEADFASDGGEQTSALPERTLRNRRRVVDVDSEDEYVPDAGESSFNADGGFLPDAASEEDEGEGGGFLPDNDPTMKNEIGSSGGVVPYGELANGIDDGGGGFVVEDEEQEILPVVEEPIISNTAIDHGPISPRKDEFQSDQGMGINGSDNSKTLGLDRSAMGPAEEAALGVNTHETTHEDDRATAKFLGDQNLPETHDTLDDSTMKEDEDKDVQSDIGSMLSHDPEDEDAEPDWLQEDD